MEWRPYFLFQGDIKISFTLLSLDVWSIKGVRNIFGKLLACACSLFVREEVILDQACSLHASLLMSNYDERTEKRHVVGLNKQSNVFLLLCLLFSQFSFLFSIFYQLSWRSTTMSVLKLFIIKGQQFYGNYFTLFCSNLVFMIHFEFRHT